MKVGDWVQITKYDGPSKDENIVGSFAKVLGVDKKDVSLLVLDYKVSQTWGNKVNLVVTNQEVQPIDLGMVRDANNVMINVGDTVAWATYYGHLSQGTVLDIIPIRTSSYKWNAETKKSDKTYSVEFSLQVEIDGKSGAYNYSSDSKESRSAYYDAPTKRRVRGLHRVLVTKQKDPCENASQPSPVWPGGTQVYPSFPSQPLTNPPAQWPGNGIKVTADSALTAQK